ncbi:MAG: hypothetical protein AAF530_24305 [Pseudomonadota bacterium]
MPPFASKNAIWILRVIAIIGLVLFGSLLAITFASPHTFETAARDFVKSQIEKEIREKYQTAAESSFVEKASDLAQRLGLEQQQLQEALDRDLPQKIAQVIAELCQQNCEQQAATTKLITKGILGKIAGLQVQQQSLVDIIKGKYQEIITKLRTDVRIFWGSNLAMFAILLAISFAKRKAAAQLFLPGLLLFASTLCASAIYLFGQNWFFTILYNDYMGFWYLAYLGLIFTLLLDIIFNRARVTTRLINFVANVMGSSLSLVPC